MPESHYNRSDGLEEFMASRLAQIQAAYLRPNSSQGAAWLASLRKASREPGASPETWLIEFEGFPENLIGKTDEPSRAERAAHLAFTLYAVHQQSQNEPMHKRGREYGIGRSVARLDFNQRKESDSTPRGKLPTRFAALGTASSFDEVSHYARQLVTQLRGASIPVDYAKLAVQLYRIQNPATADSVRLQWGRDFAGATLVASNTPTDSSQKDE